MGRREAARLSPEEIRYSTEGEAAELGAAYPGWRLSSANPEERGFRKGINMGNDDEFIWSEFPDRR